MTLKTYGILKGTVIGHKRDADDDHYQILVDPGKGLHRIASNVKSSAPNAPSTVLFWSTTSVPDEFKQKLTKLKSGYQSVPSKPKGLALDYVRSGWIKTDKFVPVPPDKPGVDNDLKDKLEAAVVRAIRESGSIIYAFGEKWGPEKNKADKYFKFKPGNGIHDIHMNQGNDGKYKKDNGVFQDGALIFQFANNKWLAFFFVFQSQSFQTDDNGNRIDGPGVSSGASGKTKVKQLSKVKESKPEKAKLNKAQAKKPSKKTVQSRTRK